MEDTYSSVPEESGSQGATGIFGSGDCLNVLHPDMSSLHSESSTTANRDGTGSNTDIDHLTLTTLPQELFYYICSFLDAKFVLLTLNCVCKQIHELVEDSVFWKVRMGKRWSKKYPAIPVQETNFNWAQACLEREEQQRVWGTKDENTDYFRFSRGLYAPVDVVHFMRKSNLLTFGSRDRYLTAIDVSKLQADDVSSLDAATVFSKMNAHKGWIWCLDSVDSTLATGSWDTYIKLWDINDSDQEISKIRCNSAILCMQYEPNFIAAGGYDKKVYHIDTRDCSIIKTMWYHRSAVLCMAMDERYIITGSEDKKIAIYDRVAGKVLKKIQMEEYPMSLSYSGNQLWAGDKKGHLHLIDARPGCFNIVNAYDCGHTGKVTGVIHTKGAIFTSSTDKTVKVLEPTIDPGVISTLTASSHAEVAGIDHYRGVLASANSDVSVGIWRPKDYTPYTD